MEQLHGLFFTLHARFVLTRGMHRRPLLTLLNAYAANHRDESATVSRFREFVTAYERCFERDCWTGHITGSAWLVNRSGLCVLLTHHRKLGRWLQLGGHSDGDPNPLRVAMTEAREESALEVTPLSADIFDLDVHEIPARKQDPVHLHFDVRFALQVVGREDFTVSDESLDLAWVPISRIGEFAGDESVLRMARKWRRRF